MERPERILIVERCTPESCLLTHVTDEAGGGSFAFEHVRELGAAVRELGAARYDAVVLDLAVDGARGLASFTRLYAQLPEVPIVVVADPEDEVAALKAVQHGALDYLLRGEIYGTMLVRSLHHAIERRRAAVELAAAEAHSRRLIETSPYGIYALDVEGRFTALNPAGERILARPAATVVGRPFVEVLAEEEREEVARRFAEAARAGGELPETELSVVRPDGERRLLSVTLTWLREEGRLVGLHGVGRDITEERTRDEQVRLLAAALEAVDDGVSVIDRHGHVHYTNATYTRLLGYGAGASLLDGAGGGEDEELARERRAIIREARLHGRWKGRVQRRTEDGRTIPLELNVRRIEFARRELLFIIARDISQELANEQQLRRVERLASLGTLIGGVAHELNNPLASIKSFTQVLLLDDHGRSQREALEIIGREADRAARIVADLRPLTWQAQEGRENVREPVDLNEVVRHILRLRRYSLESHGIVVDEELAPGLPALSADRSQMEQVVLNLVLNAEQALAGVEGERRLVLRSWANRTRILLEVRDSGVGIEGRYMERIFDPFWTTKAPGEGTGLGLSLVHSMVTDHGGAIRVESEPGSGATFVVDLPRPAVLQAAVPASALPGPAARPLRVLVVDDEPAIRLAVLHFLRRRGHRVEVAADGREALSRVDAALAAGEPFDVVLSDLRMPGIDGAALHAELRARPGLEGSCFMIMTGDARSSGAIPAEVPVILKPFNLTALAEILESHAEQGALTGE